MLCMDLYLDKCHEDLYILLRNNTCYAEMNKHMHCSFVLREHLFNMVELYDDLIAIVSHAIMFLVSCDRSNKIP